MKKVISAVLVYTLTVPTGLAFAQGPAGAAAPAGTPGLQASAVRAAQTITLETTATPASAQSFPRTLPRTGKRFNQGGGGGMMVMSLIGTAAGLAGTYYMVKMMRDQNKDTKTAGLR